MIAENEGRRLTRRQLVQAGAGAAGAVALGGAALAAVDLSRKSPRPVIHSRGVRARGTVRVFHSRPDLRPPTVTVAGAERAVARGHLFLGPGQTKISQAGPLMLDHRGEPVWFRPVGPDLWAANFRTWTYRGQPVLAWWQGTMIFPAGYGRGEGVVVDRSYREIARVRASGAHYIDMHELQLTPQGTALFTCYPITVPMDLSALGGPRHGQVLEAVFQEVDLATGRLLFEWRSLDHIPVSESYRPIDEPYDYFHLNSIDVLPDGNLLISARHTWALYKLDRRTGEVIWRLGGKRSDFRIGADAQFSWQHDARQISEQTFTVFDDGTDGPIKTERQSRAIVLELNTAANTVALVHSYPHPSPLLSSAMGSAQALPDGHLLVGWGTQAYASEFAADGKLVADARMPPGQQSYRAYRLPWRGAPHDHPAIAAGRDLASGAALVYASWNGANDVARWELRAGPVSTRLQPVGIARRHGFETAIPVPADQRYVAVTALNRHGQRLGDSAPISVRSAD